jgi:pyrophosphatase PpaX
VLFDLDGTLADTVDLILRCFRYTMSVHRGAVSDDARWLATIGMPLREQLKAFADSPEEVVRMAETYAEYQGSIHDEHVAAFPGAVALMGALRSAGTPVGVVTSKRSGMAERTLKTCGLHGTYDVLVGSDDVVQAKPHPEPVLLALSQLGLSDQADRTLFVGDSPFDMRSGRAAGVKTAAATWGPCAPEVLRAEAPDYLVENLNDVLVLTR